MRIVFVIPDVTKAKTAKQIEREAREALAIYWLARGEIEPEGARQMIAAEPPRRDFKSLLASMPDVGEDADFTRTPETPRPDVRWDT
jgi:hypothetical protein